MGQDPQVFLGVCGKFHAFPLARAFSKVDRLGGLYAADHHFRSPAGVPRSKYFNRWDIKYWRAVASRTPFKLGHSFAREHEIFDDWLFRKLSRQRAGGIYHGWNSHAPRTLQKLDPGLWLRCIERSCPHNQFQHDIVTEESERLGIPYAADPVALESAIQELYDADVIVAPSSYSAGSYSDPVLQKKVRVNPLGANYPFREKQRIPNAPLRILLVGNAFLRKGTHYLVEAFARLSDPSAELWIRGEVPPGYRSRITDSRVKIFPPVTFSQLQKLYAEATLFCLPSIDEGFGMVALEAISFGLPIIYTDHCGVGDLLNDRVGRRVPIRDPESILGAIENLRQWNESDFAAFDQERSRLLPEVSWTRCAERMLKTVYQRK